MYVTCKGMFNAVMICMKCRSRLELYLIYVFGGIRLNDILDPSP